MNPKKIILTGIITTAFAGCSEYGCNNSYELFNISSRDNFYPHIYDNNYLYYPETIPYPGSIDFFLVDPKDHNLNRSQNHYSPRRHFNNPGLSPKIPQRTPRRYSNQIIKRPSHRTPLRINNLKKNRSRQNYKRSRSK